jgi:hypothetical protein
MLRRTFLSSISPLTAGGLLFAARPEPARITRIRIAPAQGHFHKFVAMNAYDKAPKGRTFEHALIRIETNRGVEGIGAGTYAKPDDALFAALKKLIGEDPVELLQIQNGRVSGPSDKLIPVLDAYAHLDCALFDLAGKLLNKPVWQLIGDSVRERVEAYDSTLYFSDVLHPDKGVAAVVDECKETVRAGYSALNSNWAETSNGCRVTRGGNATSKWCTRCELRSVLTFASWPTPIMVTGAASMKPGIFLKKRERTISIG